MALKRVKYESATSICQICNSQIGVGNVYEWGTKIGNNYRMVHPACKNYPPPNKCECNIYTHEKGHCLNIPKVYVKLIETGEVRHICEDCILAYQESDFTVEIIPDRMEEKKNDMKIKCTHCSNQALYTNNEGNWVCEKHQDYKGGNGNVDIHEIAKELRKYITLEDIDAIIAAKDKLKEFNIEGILEAMDTQRTDFIEKEKQFNGRLAEIEQLLKEQKKKLIPKIVKIEILGNERLIVGKHKAFPELVQLLANKTDCFLNGPAGGGKNTAVEQAAKELDAKFYFLQLSQLSLKSELTGYKNIVNDNFIPTTFVKAYQHGGIFFADEFDNWAPTVVTSVNMALANGFYEFANGTIERHKDFVFVAAGNTIGLGAENHYVTSRALSGASRDRLVFLHWPIDEELEKQMVNEKHLPYVVFVQKCRNIVEKNGSQILITPRATLQGAKMFDIGWNKEQVIKSIVLRGQECPSYLKATVDEYLRS